MANDWQPYREPLRVTLVRTATIALVAGAVLARWWGGLAHWPLATVLMLWPSLGGHWIELWFLNWLRPRLTAGRDVQVTARVAVWFLGGIVLAFGMRVTLVALGDVRRVRWPALWLGGLAFIAIELVAQFVLQLRRRPSFFNGRG